MYEFFVVIMPEIIGLLAFGVMLTFAVGFAARAVGVVRRRDAYVARLERYRADAVAVLAALTVHRSIDAAPEFVQQQLTRLLASNPKQEINQ